MSTMSIKFLYVLVALVLVCGLTTAVVVPQVNVPSPSSGPLVSSGVKESPLLSHPVMRSSFAPVVHSPAESSIVGGAGPIGVTSGEVKAERSVSSTPEGIPLNPEGGDGYRFTGDYSDGTIYIEHSGTYYLTDNFLQGRVYIESNDVILDGNKKIFNSEGLSHAAIYGGLKNNITIKNFHEITSRIAIELAGDSCTITGNTIHGSGKAIWISTISKDLTITNNRIYDNDVGIYCYTLTNTGNGVIYNNYLANDINVQFYAGDPSVFTWNRPGGPVEEINIMGGPNIAGNYWSNSAGSGWSDSRQDSHGYSTTETYSDGTGVTDNYPLVNIADPTLTSVTPSSGVNTAAASVTLTGTDLHAGATVNLTMSGQTNITGTNVQKGTEFTTITCSLPITGAQAGAWDVYVKNPTGQETSLANGFTVQNPKPTITGLSPNNEVANTHTANYPVTVTGTNFVSGCTATLNGVARAVTYVSSTQVTVTFLKGDDDAAGSYPVVVTNPSPSAGASASFNYVVGNPAPTITGITPASGVNTGTVATTITGTNFVAGTNTVKLTRSGQADITAANVNRVSSTKITCNLPLSGKTAGTWNVVLTSGGKTGTKTNGFTVQNPKPTITSLSPNNEVANTHTANFPVTVTGTNFVSGCTATLKGQNRAVTFVSSTKVTVTFLKGDDDTAGSYPVVITNPSPSAGASASFNYVVGNPAPTITSITPATGVNTGTIATTITGTNFRAGASVQLTKSGQTAITGTSVSFKSATRITCKLPLKGKSSGKWNVVVSNKGGKKATKANGFTITSPVPTITAVSPKTGSIYKNTQVTITGTNFRAGVSVKMMKGSTTLTGTVTSITSNKIICTLPTKGAGSGIWSLKVTNSDTTTVTKTNTFAVR